MDLKIFLCADLPAEILLHGLPLELLPSIPVPAVNAQRRKDAVFQLLAAGIPEGEAGALAGVLVVARITLSSRPPVSRTMGQGSVAHGNHLA